MVAFNAPEAGTMDIQVTLIGLNGLSDNNNNTNTHVQETKLRGGILEELWWVLEEEMRALIRSCFTVQVCKKIKKKL